MGKNLISRLNFADKEDYSDGVMNRPKVQRRVGKYEVGKTLGQGTFAKVRCAVDTETGERVALKILDKEKVLKHKMAEQVTYIPNKQK